MEEIAKPSILLALLQAALLAVDDQQGYRQSGPPHRSHHRVQRPEHCSAVPIRRPNNDGVREPF
ncbi:hypothetical protein [Streptomyces umbrinus]|uniref:hypothetical protein n=1 Tax=Streptomyces umbrinus TaxID=67370 RepID=UPI003C2E941F